MRGYMDIRVFCPYGKDCPVKERQKKNSARTELCLLDNHPEDCKLIREGGKYESVHQWPHEWIQELE